MVLITNAAAAGRDVSAAAAERFWRDILHQQQQPEDDNADSVQVCLLGPGVYIYSCKDFWPAWLGQHAGNFLLLGVAMH